MTTGTNDSQPELMPKLKNSKEGEKRWVNSIVLTRTGRPRAKRVKRRPDTK